MRLLRTPRIDALLERTQSARLQPTDAVLGPQWVEHRYLIAVAKHQQRPLRDVLGGSRVYIDPPPPSPRPSQEYEQLMARLRAEEQERQYRMLVQEPAPAAALSTSEMKEVKEQLTTVLNVMVSIVAIAWAFWHWTASWDLAARTLISLFAGIGIGVAETVVYLGYKRRVAEARLKERAVKERRNVVKRIVFDHGVEKTVEPDSEARVSDAANSDTATSTSSANQSSPHLHLRKRTDA